MKKIVVAAVIAIWCVPSATPAGERVGDAALGALSELLFWGPSARSPVLSSATQRDPQLLTLGDLGDPSRDNLRSYPRRLRPSECLPRK